MEVAKSDRPAMHTRKMWLVALFPLWGSVGSLRVLWGPSGPRGVLQGLSLGGAAVVRRESPWSPDCEPSPAFSSPSQVRKAGWALGAETRSRVCGGGGGGDSDPSTTRRQEQLPSLQKEGARRRRPSLLPSLLIPRLPLEGTGCGSSLPSRSTQWDEKSVGKTQTRSESRESR